MPPITPGYTITQTSAGTAPTVEDFESFADLDVPAGFTQTSPADARNVHEVGTVAGEKALFLRLLWAGSGSGAGFTRIVVEWAGGPAGISGQEVDMLVRVRPVGTFWTVPRFRDTGGGTRDGTAARGKNIGATKELALANATAGGISGAHAGTTVTTAWDAAAWSYLRARGSGTRTIESKTWQVGDVPPGAWANTVSPAGAAVYGPVAFGLEGSLTADTSLAIGTVSVFVGAPTSTVTVTGIPTGFSVALDGGTPVAETDGSAVLTLADPHLAGATLDLLDADDAVVATYEGAIWGGSTYLVDGLWLSGEFVTHLDVLMEKVEGAGTVMQSVASFFGINWIKSATVQPAGVDRPIGSGTLVLHRQVDGVSLAALVEASAANQDGASYVPFTDFGREIEFRVALVPPGTEPEPEDFAIVFQGITDDPQWPKRDGDVSVPFRDRSGALADAYVRKGTVYGDEDDPVDAFEVMQEILDTEYASGGYVLVDETVGDRFLVRRYFPEGVSVWTALETVAAQWGGKRVEQRQDATTGEVYLAVVEPDREATTADYTVTQSTYIEVNQITTGGKNVRTIVRGRAVDHDTGELIESQLPAEVDVPTDPGVLAYGERLLDFSEDANSLIDSQPELDAMVAAIYADVSTPVIPLEMETKLAPFVRVDDMVQWGPNTLAFDNPLTAAVLTYDMLFPAPGVGRTVWRCAGRQRSSVLGHIRRSGVQISGINGQRRTPNRPYFLSVVVTHSPLGVLSCAVAVPPSPYVVRYRVWSRAGASPLGLDGEPDPLYLKGPAAEGREVETLTWAVQDGTHYVVARAYSQPGAHVQVTRSIVITGVGSGPGGGGADADTPDVAPGSPSVAMHDNVIVDDTRSVRASWYNTGASGTWHVQLRWYADGVLADTEVLAPSSDVTGTAERWYTLYERASVDVRYINQAADPDTEGPLAVMDNDLLVTPFDIPE